MSAGLKGYRRLELAELQAVEHEFVQFLAANSITAPDWERLKAETPEKAEVLMDLFSGIFWDEALSRITFLLQREDLVFRAFHADGESIEVFEVRIDGALGVAFSREADWNRLSQGEVGLTELGAEVFRGRRAVGEQRNAEMFRLIEAGATPCGEGLYLSLKKLFG